jgi:hypothetical protein
MEVKPKQALAIWRMLTAEADDVREPMWSKVRPKLTASERKELLQQGLVVTTRRGRANHLVLTQEAWKWAQKSGQVELGKSAEGAAALQGLLRRLLPYLEHHSIRLLDILGGTSVETSEPERKAPSAPSTQTPSEEAEPKGALVPNRILERIRALAEKAPAGGVRIVALRAALPHFSRETFDDALLSLRKAGLILLYPDDDRASLTDADHDAAVVEGETPRHLVYLENR